MRKIAKWIVKYRIVFAVIFIALAISGIYFSTLVKQNYDMTAYLPSDTDTSRGYAVMQKEFGLNNNVLLMLEINESEIDDMSDELGQINGVQLVTLNSYKDGKALFMLTLVGDEYSAEAKATLKDLRAFLDSKEYALSGGLVSSSTLESKLKTEIPIIMIIAVVIITLVLLLTSHSWLEPLVFAIVLACAVLINMGSNFIFGEISYITFAVSAILQIALAMDYSIILLHGFTERKNKGMDKEEALIEALEYNMRPISSSGLTTIAGLISLLFMSFTIGFDIGIVLAKGILVSLLSVFLLMPSLILIFSKGLDKTKHKSIPLGGSKIASLSISCRKVLPVIMVLTIAAACVLQFGNTYMFSGWDDSKDQRLIAEEFGYVNQAAIIINNEVSEDEDIQKKFESSLSKLTNEDGRPAISSIRSWASLQLDYETVMGNINLNPNSIMPIIKAVIGGTTIGDLKRVWSECGEDIYEIEIPIDALATIMKQSEKSPIVKDTYEKLSENGRVTLWSAVNNIEKTSPIVQTALSSKVKAVINVLKKDRQKISAAIEAIVSPELIEAEQKYGEDADISEIRLDIEPLFKTVCNVFFAGDNIVVSRFYKMFTDADNDVGNIVITEDIVKNAEKSGFAKIKDILPELSQNNITLKDAIDHLGKQFDEILDIDKKVLGVCVLLQSFADVFLPDVNTTVMNLLATLRETFIGTEHSRIILLMDLPQDGQKTFEAIDAIKSEANECFGIDNYVAGASMTTKDISEAFSSDLLKINLVTILSIILIIAILFRSVSLPIILVLVIQGAIWITMSIYAIVGTPIFFMSYIICICIQMGATIDYGILISSNYRRNRATMDKKTALTESVRSAMPTIFTSGLILIAAGFIIGFVSTVLPIYSIGRMLGLGTIISIILILFLLPAVLYIFDKPISKTTWDGIRTK